MEVLSEKQQNKLKKQIKKTKEYIIFMLEDKYKHTDNRFFIHYVGGPDTQALVYRKELIELTNQIEKKYQNDYDMINKISNIKEKYKKLLNRNSY
jgi:hypothetical protein